MKERRPAGGLRRRPERAPRRRRRARESVARLADFPGDLTTGLLDAAEEAEERFAALPDEEYCPALDPDALTCDLYEARPITCRIFGPAVRSRSEERRVGKECRSRW